MKFRKFKRGHSQETVPSNLILSVCRALAILQTEIHGQTVGNNFDLKIG